jgi:GR25 family glycosyltransferase involved in LPS biosynthesis
MTKFKKEAAKARFQRYERWPAVVGAELQPSIQLQRLFDNNDYDMRCGIVGCALSHIGLYIKLLNDPYANYYLILEDDATFVPNFVDKLDSVCGILSRSEYRHWDLVYLGHHPRFIGVGDGLNHSDEIRLEKKMASEALGYSLGGTAGYLIAKSGALKLLKFIDRRGMSNAIDTIQQLAADELHVYYAVPLLVPSECVRTPEDVTKVDSDIQFCSKSLTLPFEVVIEKELEFYAAREMKLVKVAIDDSFPTEEDWYIVVDAEDLLSSQDRLAEIFNRASRKDDKHVYFLQDPYFPPFVRNRALFCVDLSRSTFKSRLCPDTDGVYSIAF